MRFRLLYVFPFAALMGSLYAGPVAIGQNQLGVQSVAGLTLNGAGICNVQNVGGCGGGFTATVAGKAGVTLWCVDSQLFDQANYTANIVSLNTADATFDNGTQVRYGSIASSNVAIAPHWLYNLTGIAGVTNPDEALTRYRLAAALITLYQPEQAPTDASNPNNDDIQKAIWQLTENSSIAPGRNVSQGTNGQPDLGVREDFWIQKAANALNSGFDVGGWAVVSGAYANGALVGPPNAVQTYLVQVTPEPRFYSVVLAGLLSLCAVIYRRRASR